MKTLFAVSLVLASSITAQAVECRLARPIPFSGSVVKDRYLSRMVTDQTPKFLRPENYDPQRDELAMVLFEMANQGNATGLLGAKLGLANGGQYVGFSNSYSGATDMEGGVETAAGISVHWSRVTVIYGDSGGIPAIYELRVGVRGQEIVSVQLKHPVFEVTDTDGPYTYIRFTGENQNLCVTSAR